MTRENGLVLLSGGLDSGVNLAVADLKLNVELALFIKYGQANCDKEIQAARKITNHYDIDLIINDQTWMQNILKSGLINKNNIPVYNELSELGAESAKLVWAANRNAFFVNLACVYAETLSIKNIITGFNAEEAKTFPDNSPEFIQSINNLFKYSTLSHPVLESYTQNMNKSEITAKGKEIDFPFEYIHSCYLDNDLMCGKCESCLRLINALKENNILDKYRFRFMELKH